MKKFLILVLGLVLIVAPTLVFAQVSTGTSCASQIGIQAVICKIGEILNTLIPILLVAGVVIFIWGIIQYVIAGDEEAKKKGRSRMVYGLIGLVVIVGLWGLVRIVTSTFSINNTTTNIKPPCVPGTPGC